MEIIWGARAISDLESIREFIAGDNPKTASRVVTAIRGSVDRLARHPSLGRPGRVTDTRELIVRSAPYIVAYRVAQNQVRVLAVIHTSRQWPRRL